MSRGDERNRTPNTMIDVRSENVRDGKKEQGERSLEEADHPKRGRGGRHGAGFSALDAPAIRTKQTSDAILTGLMQKSTLEPTHTVEVERWCMDTVTKSNAGLPLVPYRIGALVRWWDLQYMMCMSCKARGGNERSR